MTERKTGLEALLNRFASSVSAEAGADDHYARMQLRAVRELLFNLGTRVEWRRDDIAANERALNEALAALGAASTSSTQAADAGSLPTLRSDLAGIIQHVYDADQDAAWRERALQEIWRVVRFEFDAEAQRIRTGMYS